MLLLQKKAQNVSVIGLSSWEILFTRKANWVQQCKTSTVYNAQWDEYLDVKKKTGHEMLATDMIQNQGNVCERKRRWERGTDLRNKGSWEKSQRKCHYNLLFYEHQIFESVSTTSWTCWNETWYLAARIYHSHRTLTYQTWGSNDQSQLLYLSGGFILYF